MTQRLHDKIALITGATRGVGRATALALAREGAHVVLAVTQPEKSRVFLIEMLPMSQGL